MIQWNHCIKPSVFFVQGIQISEVFPTPHTETAIAVLAERELSFNATNDKGGYGLLQPAIVVVVVVYLIAFFVKAGKAQRADRIDVKPTVERRWAAKRIHHLVDKHRGWLMCGIDRNVYAADIAHALGVSKGHSGNAGSETSRVNAQNQMPGLVIVVKGLIKCTGNLVDRWGVLSPEGIHYRDAVWQQGIVEIELVVER